MWIQKSSYIFLAAKISLTDLILFTESLLFPTKDVMRFTYLISFGLFQQCEMGIIFSIYK